ncbi:hypothetical protein MWU52_16205 [Jannaschia sp. S6380]|uniref:hypothetical protein n=1 Tax=Jannaschia sp. S6380 TaxID=2926408 RepID=UPI001FF20644|nr:hypothetical protein [Jannaschia sp. S6380]MCK0169099.1 hypothetical protein [Jannaschia sp. S6380]
MTDQGPVAEQHPETAKPAPNGTRWWQWFFLYPAFGVALLSAVPNWTDRIREIYYDISNTSYDEARELQAFMQRNWQCTQSPHVWIETADQTSVDGTICPRTGDVFLRIMSSDDRVFLKGISIAGLVQQDEERSNLSLVGAAHAATSPERVSPSVDSMPQVIPVQQLAVTICQKWIDDRMFRKRVQVGGQCFDEVFDSFTGARVSQTPAPCVANC